VAVYRDEVAVYRDEVAVYRDDSAAVRGDRTRDWDDTAVCEDKTGGRDFSGR
jgi:hypothetical protein